MHLGAGRVPGSLSRPGVKCLQQTAVGFPPPITKNNPDSKKEYQKWYYNKFKEQKQEYSRLYVSKNNTKIAEYKKEYQKKTAPQRQEYNKSYYHKNRERLAQYKRTYNEMNSDKVKEKKRETYIINVKEGKRAEYIKQRKNDLQERLKKEASGLRVRRRLDFILNLQTELEEFLGVKEHEDFYRLLTSKKLVYSLTSMRPYLNFLGILEILKVRQLLLNNNLLDFISNRYMGDGAIWICSSIYLERPQQCPTPTWKLREKVGSEIKGRLV